MSFAETFLSARLSIRALNRTFVTGKPSSSYIARHASTSSTAFRFQQHRFHTQVRTFTASSKTMTSNDHQTGKGRDPAAEKHNQETEGVSEWKKRPPYLIHDQNENFPVKYEANCHCGRVKYQLSREEPLDSKLCHCTTCQTQHGTSIPIIPNRARNRSRRKRIVASE